MQNLSKIGQETKKLQKMGNDIIVTSFLKIAQQFFVCEHLLLIPIDVASFKLIESQIKELQGVVPNTPGLRMTKNSLARIILRMSPVWETTGERYADVIWYRTNPNDF